MERFPALARVLFEIEAAEPLRLPPYPGSAWRGLLGHSLRRTVCVTRQPTCTGCLLLGTCAYSVFFESPPPDPESAARYTALPHPFVLDLEAPAERDVAQGAPLPLGMTLIGPAIDLLPYLIQTVERAGQRGLGSRGGRFLLHRALAEEGLGSDQWRPVFDADSREYRRLINPPPGRPSVAPTGPIRIDIQTPLRIKRQGHFVGAAEIEPRDLIRNLLTRLDSLSAFYGDPGNPSRWTALAPRACDLEMTAKDLRWIDWTRYSSRQRTTMQMGGLLGTLTLDGAGIRDLWPALWLGQWTHVGKGTSFGLGKYRVTGPRPPGPATAAPQGTGSPAAT
jgi:hypothetical protein